MLQIQTLLTSTHGTLLGGNFLILLGITLAACVLGIQVACIVTLIKKLSQAGKERERLEGQESHESYSEFGFAAIGASVLPMSAEGILTIAIGLNVLTAIVFVILVAVVRGKGYDFAAFGRDSEENAEKQMDVRVPPRIEREEEYVPAQTQSFPEQAAAVFDDAPELGEVAAEMPVETPAEVAAVAAFAQNGVSAPAVMNGDAATLVKSADGQTPVRIVKIEKEFSETIRETIPGTPVAETSNDQTQQLIAKIDRLIDKLEGTNEAQKAIHIENGIVLAKDEPVPVDEDEEDEDELDDETVVSDGGEEDDDFDPEADESEHFTGNERIIGFDEETGYYIMAHYRKSFTAKLIQSRPNIKHYYSGLKNALLAYNGTKSRISWAADSFHNGRTQIAKINVKTKTLELYLALDPASLDGTVYRGQDVSHLKKYSDTPFKYKLRTPRKFKWALELVQRVCEEHGLSPIDIETVDYEAEFPFEDTDSLVARGLIKEYIREEKPASTFELDESHVPTVTDLDETVIPANANISWEFDNEVLAQKEIEETPVVAEEPAPAVAEEPPVEEPTEEPVKEAPPAVATPTVIRETTRVTQMRYTEQNFGVSGDTNSYKEYLSADGPFKVDFFEQVPEKSETSETVQTVESSETVEEYVEEPIQNTDSDVVEADSVPYEETGSDVEYAEVADDAEVEEPLDWSVPAGLSQQEVVVIDADYETDGDSDFYEESSEIYADDQTDAIYEDDNGESYEEVYEDAVTYEEDAPFDTDESYESDVVYEDSDAVYEDGEVYYEDEPTDYEDGQYAEEYYEEPVMEEPTVQIPKINPDIALVEIGMMNEHFNDGDWIDLETLKNKGLVLESAKTLKIYLSPGSVVTKSFTVVADELTMDAIYAISGANGNIKVIQK